ncbi:MAG: tetratricopeptide repeat protein [Planctomycetota bacterium]|jgi:tetratricopeptide (TPR) repeat protein
MKSPSILALLALGALAAGVRAQIELPGEGIRPEAHLPAVPPIQVQNPFLPFDQARFEKAARELGGTELQVKTFAEEVEEIGAARAADDLMRKVFPKLDEAVTAAYDRDPKAALLLTQVLVNTKSPVLQAHVRYHLARLFLDSNDPERAIEVLNEYLTHNLNCTPLDGEAAYFYAQSLAEIPMIDAAIPRFRAFLAWFPNASERLRSAAHQRLLELERQRESRLHMLADGMKKTERDLGKNKTDKPLQLDQETYIEELEELIEMFEEMENQSSGAPSGNGPSSNPAANSALPGGEGNVGDLKKRPSLADRWGDMRDSERKKIMADVQNTMPPQYQKMLEEYYKKLGKADRK